MGVDSSLEEEPLGRRERLGVLHGLLHLNKIKIEMKNKIIGTKRRKENLGPFVGLEGEGANRLRPSIPERAPMARLIRGGSWNRK